jgi:hypothetical protein
MARVQMNDKQHVSAGLTLLDLDGQPIKALPEGASIAFSSDNPDVAQFTPDESQLNGDIGSGAVGTANITGTITFADGTVKSDVLEVEVVNSGPGSAQFTVGVPQDEV